MSDIVERLRGVYRIAITDGLGAVGAGEEPNNPDEFVRRFETPPIQHQAADEITALRARVAELEEALREYACDCSGRKCDPDRSPCGENARAELTKAGESK